MHVERCSRYSKDLGLDLIIGAGLFMARPTYLSERRKFTLEINFCYLHMIVLARSMDRLKY